LLPWSRGGKEISQVPSGAAVYACEGGKPLYVRYASDGKSATVIRPDREYRLDRVAAAASERYSNGRDNLAIADGELRLEEGSGALTLCKADKAK